MGTPPPLVCFLLASLLLAGCASPEAPAAADPADGPVTPASAPPMGALPIQANASSWWVAPREAVTLRAMGPAEARYEWFLDKLGDERQPASTTSGGASPMATLVPGQKVRMGPGHEGEADHDVPETFPAPRVDLTVPADGNASHAFAQAGRYQLLAGTARLDVLVLPDAPAGATVRLAKDTFDPPRATLAPGGTLTFLNEGDANVRVLLTNFMLHLAGGKATITTSTTYQGQHDALVLAWTDAAMGEARTRLVVDALKPSQTREYPPMKGTFDLGLAQDPNAAPKTHALPSDYPIRTLTITYTATSQTPAPPLLRLELVLDGQSIATSEPASGGELVVEDLPAGRYELRVHADQAVLAEYEALAIAQLVLEAPVRAEGGDHGMHGGGPINPCDPNPIPPPGRDEAVCF